MSEHSDQAIATELVSRGLASGPDDGFVREFEVPRIKAMQRALRAHGPEASPLKVLDIGYLDGRVPFVLSLLDADLAITCTERDEDAARSARERAERLTPGVEVEALDLTEIAGGGHRFHAVLIGEVLEHISVEHLPGIFSGLREMLYENGVVIVTTPNLHGIVPRVRHLLGLDFTHDPIPEETMGLPHINLLSARQISDLGRAAGLEVEAVEFRDLTSNMRAAASRARRLAQGFRRMTLSRIAPSTRDDLLVVLRRRADVREPSVVYARQNASFRESLTAAREAAGTRRLD